jgi:glycerol kinase
METTALGAAYLAGIATGIWSGPDQLKSKWQIDKTFIPQINKSIIEHKLQKWHKAVKCVRDWSIE